MWRRLNPNVPCRVPHFGEQGPHYKFERHPDRNQSPTQKK